MLSIFHPEPALPLEVQKKISLLRALGTPVVIGGWAVVMAAFIGFIPAKWATLGGAAETLVAYYLIGKIRQLRNAAVE